MHGQIEQRASAAFSLLLPRRDRARGGREHGAHAHGGSYRAAADRRSSPLDEWVVAIVESHHRDEARPPRRLENAASIVHRRGERLLHVHVLAPVQCCDRGAGMECRWQRNDDRVHVGHREDVAVLRHGAGVGRERAGRVEVCRHRVGERDDPPAGNTGERPQMR
jgi:hypothetical protein